ncbi:MAG TPA: hypothetical protein VFS65_00700 [Candidatus Saccharimonadales bacterium]|nr:hypothetical protein [Candidatus Saccharimonadales bacterium]
MTIQTGNLAMVALNTPDGHKFIATDKRDINEIEKVDVKTKKVKLKKIQKDPISLPNK